MMFATGECFQNDVFYRGVKHICETPTGNIRVKHHVKHTCENWSFDKINHIWCSKILHIKSCIIDW